MSSSVPGPAADSAARPGSCRKPPSLLHVKSGKEGDLLAVAFAFVVRWELTTFLRSGGAPHTAVHVAGPEGCPIGLRMQPRNEKLFPLCRQGPNAVERAVILPEVVAPRERWAKLAKRTTAELHGRRSPNRPAPKRTAPRHPRPGRPDRGPAVPPHRPDPRPVRRLHRPASTPGNAAGAPPSPLMTKVHSIRQSGNQSLVCCVSQGLVTCLMP